MPGSAHLTAALTLKCVGHSANVNIFSVKSSPRLLIRSGAFRKSGFYDVADEAEDLLAATALPLGAQDEAKNKVDDLALKCDSHRGRGQLRPDVPGRTRETHKNKTVMTGSLKILHDMFSNLRAESFGFAFGAWHEAF